VARLALLWPAASVLKRTASLARLGRFFDAAPAGRPIEPTHAAWLIDGLLRRSYRQTPGYCMERSLLLFHLLRRSGHDVALCFGVHRRGDDLRGHAWVTLDGLPVAEAADPRTVYTVTYTYPDDAP
jgi:hypothetical protein